MNPEPRELKLLGTIEAVFSITGRGTVIVPIWVGDVKVRVGDAIQLRALDGKRRDTRVYGVELIKPQKGSCQAAFILAPDIAKEEIVDGMEIWI